MKTFRKVTGFECDNITCDDINILGQLMQDSEVVLDEPVDGVIQLSNKIQFTKNLYIMDSSTVIDQVKEFAK